jgi:Kef-type K+ transport system membrane component KefB
VEPIFYEIAVIICFAAGLSIIFRLLKQPAILAYILTGVIINASHLFSGQNHLTLQTLGELGVTFLLFMIGLELKLKDLKSIGIPVIIIGSLEVWFTFVLSFFLALALGYGKVPAVYLGIAFSFSSTILVVKTLSDKKDLNSLHGKLSIGVLLIEDFFAVIALVILAGIRPDQNPSVIMITLSFIVLKAIVLIGVVVLASVTIVPKIVHAIARSSESLFLFSLAWMFALTALATAKEVGFSIEIGGFIAGLALANTSENYQIVAKMKPLRDFFITIFFVMLGLSMSFANIQSVIVPMIAFFLFAVLIRPFVVMILVGQSGYRKRTAFLVGNTMGQISEFSFILIFLGQRLGYFGNDTTSMVLFVGMLGFLTSSYFMKHAGHMYQLVERFLVFVETNEVRNQTQEHKVIELHNHVIIIGGHQMGRSIIHAMEDSKEKIVVVDFDPDVVKRLEEAAIPVVFGDIADPEIQELVQLDKAKLVISTVPDVEDNLVLLRSLDLTNKKAKIVVIALDDDDAKDLYQAGADYVVLPHLTGGRYLARMMKDAHLDTISWHKARDLAYLT